MPDTDLHGQKAQVPFFIVEGDDPLLLGNEIVNLSNLMGEENLLVIPPGIGNLSARRLTFPTYSIGDENSMRTHLHVVPCHQAHLKTFFSSFRSFRSTLLARDEAADPDSRYNDAKYAREFAVKLHVFTHLFPRDMKEICKRAKILIPVLIQALDSVFEKCKTCKQTGRPLHSRKVSFNRLLHDFNHHLQVDFMFIKEFGNLPILHMKDVATGCSATCLMMSREMGDASRMIVTKWFDVHGPPELLSGDPEFFNDYISRMCAAHNIKYEPRPARRHNKIGSVESGNGTIRFFVQRLLKDEEHFRSTRNQFHTYYEILSKATYLKNILHGGKSASSFELARGYSPSICGMPQSRLSQNIFKSYHEQSARRAVHTLLTSKDVHPVRRDGLVPGTAVYFFRREIKFGKWYSGFVQRADEHIVYVVTDKSLKSRPLQVAYEDIRLAPSSTLLRELDEIELGYAPIVENKSVEDAIERTFVPVQEPGTEEHRLPPEGLADFVVGRISIRRPIGEGNRSLE